MAEIMKLDDYRYYPARIERDPECGRYSVIVRGIPGASDADTEHEAHESAMALIFDCAGFHFDSNREYQGAGKAEDGDEVIDIGPEKALKLMIRNLLVKNRMSQRKLAALMEVAPAVMSSYLSLKKSTKLDTLCKCFECLNAPLNVSC